MDTNRAKLAIVAKLASILKLSERHQKIERCSHENFLKSSAQKITFERLIDIGAAEGDFSKKTLKYFPKISIVAIEPLEEFQSALRGNLAEAIGARIVKKAAWHSTQQITLNVHPDLFGSSLFREVEGALVDGSPREVPTTTLRTFLKDDVPTIIKLDVQGAELAILETIRKYLTSTESEIAIVVETNLFENMVGSKNTIDRLFAFFSEIGMVLYDIVGIMYRPLDNALMQLDLVFIRDGSILRSDHRYANYNQRMSQFRKARNELKNKT